ncbi:MAG: GMC family oxidoreductase [Solirubrobacteraceae bacterium]|nr:GMC family oxidoreductase [Solirubrobacteraceae bacterium]
MTAERRYDAIVIGSGFGGGAAACRMAEAGMDVAVLERGRRWEKTDFPEHFDDAPALAWHPEVNPRGLYDLRWFEDGVVLTAAGVGGGSLLYANVQLPARKEVFSSGWPEAITLDELLPWYAKSEEALMPTTTPVPYPAKVKAFTGTAKEFGGRGSKLAPIAVHFGEPRNHPLSGHPQEGCDNLGQCLTGCPLHAKNTVDITYIARAEQLGSDVYPLHEVIALEPPSRKGGRWRVHFRDLQYDTTSVMEAPTVVVAAGTLGSARLLLQSKAATMPKLSPALGEKFSGNGNALGAIFDPTAHGTTDAEVDVGPSITSVIDLWEERGFILEDLGLPPSYMVLLEALRGVNAIGARSRARLRAKEVAARVGAPDRPTSPRELKVRDLPAPSIEDVLTFLFIGKENPAGRVKLGRRGQIDIDFDPADSQLLYDRMDETLQEVAEAVGGKPVFNLAHGPLGKFIIAHPLGGVPMADDPADGVVDDFGRVYGYDGLHVLDGSIIPSPLGANPSKTIAALAERGVAQLIADRS